LIEQIWNDADYLTLSLILGAFQQFLNLSSSSPLKSDTELLSAFYRSYDSYNRHFRKCTDIWGI